MTTSDLCTTPAYSAAQAVIRTKIKQRAEELAHLYAGLSPDEIFKMVEEPEVLALLQNDKTILNHGIHIAAHLVATGAAVIPDSSDDKQHETHE